MWAWRLGHQNRQGRGRPRDGRLRQWQLRWGVDRYRGFSRRHWQGSGVAGAKGFSSRAGHRLTAWWETSMANQVNQAPLWFLGVGG